jgi:hypothetical protein
MFMHTSAGLHLSFLGFLKRTEHILKPQQIFYKKQKRQENDRMLVKVFEVFSMMMQKNLQVEDPLVLENN